MILSVKQYRLLMRAYETNNRVSDFHIAKPYFEELLAEGFIERLPVVYDTQKITTLEKDRDTWINKAKTAIAFDWSGALYCLLYADEINYLLSKKAYMLTEKAITYIEERRAL